MSDIADLLKSKNIHLFIKNQNIDTSTSVGEFFFNIISSVAQYELELIRERVISGLENARRKGRILGRPSNLTPNVEKKILEMRSKNIGINKISKACGVGAQTIYKVLRTSDPVSVSQGA